MTTDKENLDRIWQVIDEAGICMMTARFVGGLRARPLEARPNRKEDVIWFLTDKRGLKDDEVQLHPDVCLTFSYPKEKVYLSLAFGFCEVLPDRVTILATLAERADEIDPARAEEAKKRAEERLAQATRDVDYDRARLALQKSLARLQVVSRVQLGGRVRHPRMPPQ